MGKLWDAVKELFNPNTAKEALTTTKNALDQTLKGENEAFNEAHKVDIPEDLKALGEEVKNTGFPSSWFGNNEEPTIQDTTESGIESAINGSDIMQFMQEQQEKQWAREDAIRAETQAREDTAMQRAVEDARKAGINPNLMNIQPAASGGGITSATGLEYQTYQAEMKEFLTLIEQEIENEFKGDENKKDRWNQLFSSLIMALLIKR